MKEESTGKNRGQSTLEIIIALAILTLAISTVIIVAFSNQSLIIDNQLNNQALYLARQSLEDTRAKAQENFSALTSTSTNDGFFLKEIIVQNLETYKKKVTSRISWQATPLRSQKIELTTIITDWKTVFEQSGTGDGGTGLTGNWTKPVTAGTIDLGPGNQGTDLAIKNNTVFIVAEASDPKKPDFFSIDVTNPYAPSLLANLNTGPGLESIALWQNYAYLASNKTSEQLQVVDITNPAAPTLLNSTSMINNSSNGKSIFAKDGYVYIGSLSSSSGREFQIFDVSNPASPSLVSSVEIGTDVNDIYVSKERVYLATSKSEAEIMIFDVSNPSNPIQLASFNYPGTSNGQSIFAPDYSHAFLGTGNELAILNTSNLNSISIEGSFNAGGAVNDIYVRDYLAFLATDNSNKEFQAINISNLSNPTIYSFLDFPQVATGITYLNNFVYLSVRSNNALRVITSTP